MVSTILKTVNTRGIPALNADIITSDGTTTTVNFSPHRFVGANFSGLFVVRFPQAVTTSAEPVQFTTKDVANSTTALYLNTGAPATVAALTSTAGPTFHLFFYDKESGRLQLIA